MDESSMRQDMLIELIDSMHGRLAEKSYPKETPKAEVEEKEETPVVAEEKEVDAEEPSDEELESMMSEMEQE